MLVLVTGRVWSGRGGMPLVMDIWDCEPWMEIIESHFVPCIIKELRKKPVNNKYLVKKLQERGMLLWHK